MPATVVALYNSGRKLSLELPPHLGKGDAYEAHPTVDGHHDVVCGACDRRSCLCTDRPCSATAKATKTPPPGYARAPKSATRSPAPSRTTSSMLWAAVT